MKIELSLEESHLVISTIQEWKRTLPDKGLDRFTNPLSTLAYNIEIRIAAAVRYEREMTNKFDVGSQNKPHVKPYRPPPAPPERKF